MQLSEVDAKRGIAWSKADFLYLMPNRTQERGEKWVAGAPVDLSGHLIQILVNLISAAEAAPNRNSGNYGRE